MFSGLTLATKTAHASISMAQRGTLTRMWDYSPALVVFLAILWALAVFGVACVAYLAMSDRRNAAQRNAYIPSEPSIFTVEISVPTVNLRKVS